MSILSLDPLAKMEIIAELELKTNYSWDYLKSLSDEKLIELLKERG